MSEHLYHGTTGSIGRAIAREGRLRQVGHRDKYALSRKGRIYACKSYEKALEFAKFRADATNEDDLAVVEFIAEDESIEIDEDTYASFAMLGSEREAKALYDHPGRYGSYKDAGTAIWSAMEAVRKKLEELKYRPQGHPTDPTYDWKKQIRVLKGTPELAAVTKLAKEVSVGDSPKVLHVWLVDSLSDDKEELPLGESLSDPITPIEEMGFAELIDYSESVLFYVRVNACLENSNSFHADKLALYASADMAESAGPGKTMCIECIDLDARCLEPTGGASTWQRSFLANGLCSYSGKISISDMFDPVDGEWSEPVHEGKRAQQASSIRLRKIVHDALSRSRAFRKLSKRIKVQGDQMTVRVGKKEYAFDIERDQNGWVKKATPVTGHGSKMKGVKKAVEESFRRAHFHQVISDASTGDGQRLVMLDYVRLNGGRRTRLIEAYSYRYKPSKNRSYLYGWNVEEGGIRSYIVDRIHGARITDKPFKPRFMVEIGSNPTQGGPAIIDKGLKPVVTDAMVRRGHQRFELAGGRGKIIKRLGHSVEKRS